MANVFARQLNVNGLFTIFLSLSLCNIHFLRVTTQWMEVQKSVVMIDSEF